ncbi:hypothetical protein Pmar_PMAR005892 [Perkinsus marinus ATCC 50983]|uniref:FAD/NAD(P)-binding domain-containing protein n=1 Tax=Perkinsus marinus (strain ATCC 50983 / TXsc) TaxID=423536 RepID=C5LKY7_PERM5|nr:hypothetical protein Pmar_PMAR005892 [Perkinsus marinus ATCC 50983]EER02551.1 hypothetical protein Pmar_PMAR005892 [Perkinsus marinus ATCC 50983]|eukprot:XP_002769833.1 hypothetical protein Pmar_PMAR005892 [Perkinsus marinus ATCC 50983]
MASGNRRRALVIGGGFSGLFAAHDLSTFVHPGHYEALSFTYQHVLERKRGIKFLWGEVKQLDGSRLVAHVKPMFSETTEEVPSDYCIIAAGCNFGVFHKMLDLRGLGLIDERFIEGRGKRIFEEHEKLKTLNKKKASVLVVGAGFICLGPLPNSAADDCNHYMKEKSIKVTYGIKYAPDDRAFFIKIESDKKEKDVKKRGPGGGGWIRVNNNLQVTQLNDDGSESLFGGGHIFAVGDCNFSSHLVDMGCWYVCYFTRSQ